MTDQHISDYEDVTVYTLEDDDELEMIDLQDELTFMWANKEGWPVGVIMSYVFHEGRFWITASGQRKRIAAVRRDPRVSVCVTSAGTSMGPGRTVTYKGRCTVHDDDETKAWFYPALAAKIQSSRGRSARTSSRSSSTRPGGDPRDHTDRPHRLRRPQDGQGDTGGVRGLEGRRGVSTVEDRLAIRELAERYADAVCRRDADAWGACWAAEGVWDLGIGRLVEGRSELVPFWREAMARFPMALQLVHGCLVESIDGDVATARCWLSETLTDVDGGAKATVGHYHDDLVRIDGRWHYAKRRYQTLAMTDQVASLVNPFQD